MHFRLCLTSALALATAFPALADPVFNRVASFATPANMAEGEDMARETSAEIITATEDGMTLIYSDSPLGAIGMIDITDPANPVAAGSFALPNGEPTAVSALGQTVFVAENTSESYTAPSGVLHAIDVGSRNVIASCDLGGQPDSTAVAPDGSFITVAIENERDEQRRRAETLQFERNSARAIARVLAHAYTNNNTPPPSMVDEALGFAVDQTGDRP